MDTPASPEPNVNASRAHPHPSNPLTWSEWIGANSSALIFMVLAIAFVIYRQLDPLDLLKVAIGLGLVIFIHELGHFLAAKWCDVHVETFSIGFGKPIPGCHFKYGETTYKIGWIPLGGYLKLVAEGDNADTEEAEEDPRSFKNKPVGQRMIIISAGVVMNIILAWICFIIVYSHGIDETAPIIGWVDAGSPAWQEGIHSGAYIDQIDDLKKPVFDDIKPVIMGSSQGEKVRFVFRDSPGAEPHTIEVEPGKDPDALFPMVGVGPAKQLTLRTSRRAEYKPARTGSPAASADSPFEQGDRIIATSDDPADYTKVTPLPLDKRDGADGKLDYFAFVKRLRDMRGQKMIFRVQRGDTTKDITVEPNYHLAAGMTMQMGRVTAVRKNSPAALAKVLKPTGEEEGIQPRKLDPKTGSVERSGDKITEVEVSLGDKKKRRWVAGIDKASTLDQDGFQIDVQPLDPLRLPFELEQWAESGPTDKNVRVTVLRPTARKEEKTEEKRVTLDMTWDDSARNYQETQTSLNSPLSIPGLGLAYQVDAVVESVKPGSLAEKAGIQKGDVVKEFRSRYTTPKGKVEEGKWIEIKPNQWAFVFQYFFQDADPKEINLKVERSGGIHEIKLDLEEDKTWPRDDRGLELQVDTRLHKADNLFDALAIGVHRTFRIVRVIYLNLYSMVFGRVSVFSMSGPLTIADVSYKIAGENIWQFILFIGMINVNLAVINFLPIPVLDGGHMVFLIYEKLRGKPAPEAALAIAMYVGLACILALMCFVLFLDVQRLFF